METTKINCDSCGKAVKENEAIINKEHEEIYCSDCGDKFEARFEAQAEMLKEGTIKGEWV